MNDIADFDTDALRAEIRRREAADRAGTCWYCGRDLAAHTCKHARPSPVPGWIVEPARFVRDDGGCMGEMEEYWRVDARNPVTGRHSGGSGATAAEATEKCLSSIRGDGPPPPGQAHVASILRSCRPPDTAGAAAMPPNNTEAPDA